MGSAKKMKCEKCAYSTAYKWCLQDHVKAIHDRTRDQKCDQCDYAATTATLLRVHRRHVHQGIRRKERAMVKCGKCAYTCRKPANVKRHVKLVHDKIPRFLRCYDKIPRYHRCYECDRCFPYKSTLEFHIKAIHKKIKDKICDQCDFKTSYPGELRKHKNAIHSVVRGDGFECLECGKMLTTKLNLHLHNKIVHQKVKDVSCLLCLEMFSNTGMLFNRKFINCLYCI